MLFHKTSNPQQEVKMLYFCGLPSRTLIRKKTKTLPQKATKITISPKRGQPTSEVFTCKDFTVFITLRLKGNFCNHFKYNTCRITTTYSSEKKLNSPILFKNYRVTFILTATIWSKYLSCHTLPLPNRMLKPSSTK